MTVTDAHEPLPDGQSTTPHAEMESLRLQRESACRNEVVLARNAFFILTARLAFLPLVASLGAWAAIELRAGLPANIAAVFWWWFMSRARSRWATHLRAARGLAQPSAEEALAGRSGPTVLFLRGFDRERDAETIVGANREFSSTDTDVDVRFVEAMLSRALHPVPLLALPDPRRADTLPGAHRFFIFPSRWDEFVADLIDRTSLIILYIHDVTPGVEREVALLREGRALDRTLVILESTRDPRRTERVAELVADLPHQVVFTQNEQSGLSRLAEALAPAFRTLSGADDVGLSQTALNVTARELERLHHPSVPRRIGRFLLGPLISVTSFSVLLGVVGAVFILGVVGVVLTRAIAMWDWSPVIPSLLDLGEDAAIGVAVLTVGFPALLCVLILAKWMTMGWRKGREWGDRGTRRLFALFGLN